MSDTTPERTLPAEVVYAIERLKVAAYKAGRGDDDATDGTKEMASLYAAILAALEPERELRDEHPWFEGGSWMTGTCAFCKCRMDVYSDKPGGHCPNCGKWTFGYFATSSAHEGRD